MDLICDLLAKNGTMTSIRAHCTQESISGNQQVIANMIKSNSSLEDFDFTHTTDYTEDEQHELNELAADALMENHSLCWLSFVTDDSKASHYLHLNQTGIIAATAGKGVPLPSSYVQGLPDSVVPRAIRKVRCKGGLSGVYGFLQQIHAGNLISAHVKYGRIKNQARSGWAQEVGAGRRSRKKKKRKTRT